MALRAGVAAAEVTVFEQAPHEGGGFGSDGVSIIVAEDFTLASSARIGAVVWWGAYMSVVGEPIPETDDFTIRVYRDSEGAPGALVAFYAAGNGVGRTPTGSWANAPEEPIAPPQCPPEDPACPPPFPSFPGRLEYQYRYELPVELPLDGGARYWLAVTNAPSSDSWGWSISIAAGDNAVQRSGEVFGGAWEPYTPGAAFRLVAAELPPTADMDGDTVPDAIDDCPGVANADQADFDGDGEGDACDPDDDGDAVADEVDGCPQTVIPERVPLIELGVNRLALVDGDTAFDTRLPAGIGPQSSVTTLDTHGCSCEQLLARLGGTEKGQWDFGCSIGVVHDAIRRGTTER
jgi:hypothetical protein